MDYNGFSNTQRVVATIVLIAAWPATAIGYMALGIADAAVSFVTEIMKVWSDV